MKPKKWVQSANLAIEGIIYAVKTQRHMRYHFFIAAAALKKAFAKGIWHIAKAPSDVVAFVSLAVVVITVIVIKALLGKGEPLRGGMPSGHAAVSFSIWAAAGCLTHSLSLGILTFLLALM